MRSLMLRHLNLHRRMLLGFSPIVLLWLALGCKNETAALFAGTMLGLMLSASLLLNGEAMDPNLERFLLSLPTGRAQVVREAYGSGLLALILGQALPLLVFKAGHALLPGHLQAMDPGTWGVAALAVLALTCLVCFMLPFRFALGGPRGLMAFAITLVVLIVGVFAWKGLDGVMETLGTVGGRMLDHPAQGLLGALAVLAFGGLSLALSTRLYGRRVF